MDGEKLRTIVISNNNSVLLKTSIVPIILIVCEVQMPLNVRFLINYRDFNSDYLLEIVGYLFLLTECRYYDMHLVEEKNN